MRGVIDVKIRHKYTLRMNYKLVETRSLHFGTQQGGINKNRTEGFILSRW